MKTQTIPEIHHLFLRHLKIEHNKLEIIQEFRAFYNEPEVDPKEFVNFLNETGQSISLHYILHYIPKDEFSRYIQSIDHAVLLFMEQNGIHHPLFFAPEENLEKRHGMLLDTDPSILLSLEQVQMYRDRFYHASAVDGKSGIVSISCYFVQSQTDEEQKLRPKVGLTDKITAMQRLFELFALEKSEIGYLYIYAIIAGLISLSLPLGIQSIMGFITSGQVTTSVIILIIFILIGTVITGALNVVQLRLVEQIQRRIFSRIAFNFAFRIPKFDPEYLHGKYYPPELINRFFDVPTVQKGLAKMLLDFTAALLQIFFGLLLLSFYHPYFIMLGVLLIAILVLIFSNTGPKGLKSSLRESDYKYKIVGWFEQLAQSLSTFKTSGYSRLPIDRTDDFLSNYLHAREQHFRVLITQYYSFVFFKTVVTGGLLILGAVLVINQQINIGQFVASEIIIILIISSVEKIMGNLDVVYDVLTGLTKVGKVTDLPIKLHKGINFADAHQGKGIQVDMQNVTFKYPQAKAPTIAQLNLTLRPNERVCITGSYSSGKSTLARLLLGYYEGFEGIINYDGISIREYNKNSMFKRTGDNMLRKDVFEGTILENITLGDAFMKVDQVFAAITLVGLKPYIDQLPNGIHTTLVGGNAWLKDTIADKIILARAVVSKPELLVINENELSFNQEERMELMEKLADTVHPWTLVVLSKDREVMKMFSKILLFDQGTIVFEGDLPALIRYGIPE